jgi:hypothetical protein
VVNAGCVCVRAEIGGFDMCVAREKVYKSVCVVGVRVFRRKKIYKLPRSLPRVSGNYIIQTRLLNKHKGGERGDVYIKIIIFG